MNWAEHGDVHLHWGEQGDGEPLLLIMGLGGSSRAWYRLLPHVADRARVITFDNRGTGQSDRIRGSLGLDDMVGDALAVLDAAGVESAHVVGVSMGGMIAQHLALDHRERVSSLLLGCTTPNSRAGVPPWRLLAASGIRGVAPARAFDLIVPALYARRTRREHPERIREDFAMRARESTPGATFLAQLRAVGAHDTRSRLHELAGLPVTILHGDEDGLIPPARGRELARLIPGAHHAWIPDAGHIFMTDNEDATAQAVHEHLARAMRSADPSAV